MLVSFGVRGYSGYSDSPWGSTGLHLTMGKITDIKDQTRVGHMTGL